MATIDIGKLTFTHKGDYAGGTAYVANDVVYYNGSLTSLKHQRLVIFQRVRLTGILSQLVQAEYGMLVYL
ncbi:MAG: hypothetical protein CM15mV76_270 [uncultured marine virus]|nr:MAG: hypothetical protein CM15mV76_270 [uncultured marine virus]